MEYIRKRNLDKIFPRCPICFRRMSSKGIKNHINIHLDSKLDIISLEKARKIILFEANKRTDYSFTLSNILKTINLILEDNKNGKTNKKSKH